MAGKDKAEKKLEDYNDVFAEILNVLLLNKQKEGKEVTMRIVVEK